MVFDRTMIAVALGAALFGGSAGAFFSTRQTQPAPAAPAAPLAATPVAAQPAPLLPPQTQVAAVPEEALPLDSEQAASAGVVYDQAPARASRTQTRRVYYDYNDAQPQPQPRAARTQSRTQSQRAYYDYNEPKKRSFWSKHRDKLTVAMGAGGGALIGGLIGGKKGALIGGLSGAGGSALYTYKLRKRTPQY